MYRIFLIDADNYVELDTEDISMETVFAVSDISDIDSKKDSITKNIAFKGTDNNNKAFGSLYFLNRDVDVSLDKSLFFNYSPLKRVDCTVYEDSMLILNGYLIITDVDIDSHGAITYDATITGKLIGFKQALGDSKLSDIDFADLKHQYVSQVIQDSWGANALDSSVIDQTQRYNKDTQTYSYTPFQKGSGYVYPFIDYGEKFLTEDLNNDYSHISFDNYRPAIWVNEYLDRIFKGVGFTWEVKGSTDFIDQFNSLIIPNNEEKLTTINSGFPAVYELASPNSYSETTNPITDAAKKYIVHPLPIPTRPGTQEFANYGPQYGTTDKQYTLIQFTKGVTTDGSLSVTMTDIDNRSGDGGVGVATTAELILELVKRPYSTDDGDVDSNWEIIGTTKITLNSGASKDSLTFQINILPTGFNIGDQLCVRLKDTIWWTGSSLNTPKDACTFTVTEILFTLPSNVQDSYTLYARDRDYVTPKAPQDIQQYDFVKSILSLFNLYIYNNKDNPYHLILQPYNDYYSACKAPDIFTSASNWTERIDYSKNVKIQGNINLPQKYIFTFTEDNDYLNKTYNDKYGEIYGTATLADNLGVNATKTVQVIFSPTPMVEMPDLKRIYPFIADRGTSLQEKKPIQSNIRILFYNGAAYTVHTTYSEDAIAEDTTLTTLDMFDGNIYGQASNYYLTITNDTTNKTSTYTPITDINFHPPKEFYFNASSSYLTLPGSYNNYYQSMIAELIDANLFLVECDALLNEVDIGNLDLSKPIFTDMGELGHSYFKVISVTYPGNTSISTLTLQKITL